MLGGRVRELRLERGLTQEALALESGLSRNQLISLEWGRSSLVAERLADLADALGVDVRDLFDRPQVMPVRAVNRGGRRGGPATGQ